MSSVTSRGAISRAPKENRPEAGAPPGDQVSRTSTKDSTARRPILSLPRKGKPPAQERITAQHALAQLRSRYRVIGAHAPLAIGAHREADRAALGLGIAPIRRALALHARHPRYLAACAVHNSRRVHLDGSDAGAVSPKERAYALAELARRGKAVRP